MWTIVASGVTADVRYRARMRWNSRSRRLLPVGLLTILVGALIVTACGGGSESRATVVDRWIAFASDRDGDWEIYTMRSDGTDVRRLTVNDTWDEGLAWSPDGTRIAFVSGRYGDSEIYTMRPDGTDVRQLTVNDAWAGPPAWSPDGTRIAFSSNRDGRFGGWQIYTMRSDGTDVRRLTVNDTDDWDPAWSP